MVHRKTTQTLQIVAAAAARIGLEFSPGDADRWDYKPFLKEGESDPTPTEPQTGVLRINGGVPVLGFNRPPARVGVFGTGPVVLVWDDFKEGWGLTSRLGHEGVHLAQALTMAEVEDFCLTHAWTSRLTVGPDQTMRFHLKPKEGTVPATPEIIVSVDPKGGVKIEVEGCAGPSCQSLTAALEASLGTVVADERTADFNLKPTTARVNVGQGGGG